MGKKSKSQSKTEQPAAGLPFLGGNASVDPSLASLFEQSAGPVKAPIVLPAVTKDVEDDEEEPEQDDDEEMQEAPEDSSDASAAVEDETSEAPSRKRKRTTTDDLEESYMRRIEKEEQKEAEKRRASEKAKRQKTKTEEDGSDESADEPDSDEESDASSDEEDTKPVHESKAAKADSSELDKSNRTVFLGNVSTEAIKSKSAKKTLLKHLASFCSDLPESSGPHKVESIRFRSTAFASGGRVPKRASFAKKEVLDETTPSTNAYAVYSTIQAARKAPAALNGTVVLDRHIRVDSVAHPSATDNKRCVFVGNLDFIDQEGDVDENGEPKKKKNRAPADVEEGLWRTFNTNISKPKEKNSKGNVESVRVIRDNLTRVGKGFAYVQFYDPNCVEEALLLDGKKFPPMLPRKLRVSRAKKMPKKRDAPERNAKDKALGESHRTLQGRAGKLFGRAGAAKLNAGTKQSISQNSTVFEGHRATEDGPKLKVKTKSRGSKGKPKNRSSQRAAAYRAAGGRQAKIAAKKDSS